MPVEDEPLVLGHASGGGILTCKGGEKEGLLF